MKQNLNIPKGKTKEDIKAREQFIRNFYAKWNASNPEKRVYNIDLQDFIYVRFLSIEETSRHASLNYESTLSICYLTEILSLSKIKTIKSPKNNVKNQSRFNKILIMHYESENVGKIKLTIGVLRGSKLKIQYCITSIEKTTE